MTSGPWPARWGALDSTRESRTHQVSGTGDGGMPRPPRMDRGRHGPGDRCARRARSGPPGGHPGTDPGPGPDPDPGPDPRPRSHPRGHADARGPGRTDRDPAPGGPTAAEVAAQRRARAKAAAARRERARKAAAAQRRREVLARQEAALAERRARDQAILQARATEAGVAAAGQESPETERGEGSSVPLAAWLIGALATVALLAGGLTLLRD